MREMDKNLVTRNRWLASAGIVAFFFGVLAIWVAESINTLTFGLGILLLLFCVFLLVVKTFNSFAGWLDDKLSG